MIASRQCFISTLARLVLFSTAYLSITATVSTHAKDLENELRIAQVKVEGNKTVPTETILDYIPFKPGDIYDPAKRGTAIRTLFNNLKKFRDIRLFIETLENDEIILTVSVTEGYPLKEIIIKGQKQHTEKEIKEKTGLAKATFIIDKAELGRYAYLIKKMYAEKGYHHIDVLPDLALDAQGKASVTFVIKEHPRSLVKRINFIGNTALTSKQLRSVLYTKEDWLFNIIDQAGIYQMDRIEADKHMLEQQYQNSGFMNAKVIDTKIELNEKKNAVTITHEIMEGDLYTVKDITVSGHDIANETFLRAIISLKPGDVYSKEKLIESMKTLESFWGDFGYLFASVEPSVIPDDKAKTVSISFQSELGKPVMLNMLTVKGNQKTRDKIIRRQIMLEEGTIITNSRMEATKSRLEGLGYFERKDGISWKTTRLSDDLADLDLIVKEAKTGNAYLQLSFGGAGLQSPTSGVALEASLSDSNFAGSGIRTNLMGKISAQEKTLLLNVTQPWLFDRPIFGALDIFHKRLNYEDVHYMTPITEKDTGAAVTSGVVLVTPRFSYFNDTFLRTVVGFDDVRYEHPPQLRPFTMLQGAQREQAETAYCCILNKEFQQGMFGSIGFNLGQDKKNHPVFPSRGYAWVLRSNWILPSFNSDIGFYKFDLDANWYTPLIGSYDLILRLHAFAGIVSPFTNKKTIPYRELFHIGGPASVRGFLYGQIGPQFIVPYRNNSLGDSIGGNKAFFVNAELIFPIRPDFSMQGIVFYDGGAGWDNPFVCQCNAPEGYIANNRFSFRHSVGVGIRLLSPVPVRVDWGFKLDPRKGETSYEVHFGMSSSW